MNSKIFRIAKDYHGIELIQRALALLQHTHLNPTPEEVIITKWCKEATEWLAS